MSLIFDFFTSKWHRDLDEQHRIAAAVCTILKCYLTQYMYDDARVDIMASAAILIRE